VRRVLDAECSKDKMIAVRVNPSVNETK
jgi:hypothetical protein